MTRPLNATPAGYLDWRTFKAYGVNLGSWFCLETFMLPDLFERHGKGAHDEWTLCQNLGPNVGPLLEDHYNSFFTTDHIDILAAQGVNVLRIPTTYAAWIKVPGSPHYLGSQVVILEKMATYAIEKYNMHVIIDLHSLPGGVNFLEIGEAHGHGAWFYSETNLALSYQAVEAVIAFIQGSAHAGSYTLAPVNEAVDSDNIRTFGTDLALSSKAAEHLLRYFLGVIERVEAANPGIPVMVQDSFRGEAFWAPKLPPSANVVIDTHFYYFAGRSCYPETAASLMIKDAKRAPGSRNFPVVIGEWSIETEFENKLGKRKELFDVARWAYNKYAQGSIYWSARVESDAKVSGEGGKRDYWSYLDLVKEGVIQPVDPSYSCE
ncbi:hypothetical protein TruAng_006644 [Truncatella angustata]|nr:hypothetical protein TruAng_006644 [Truncatella angustata]